MNIATKPRASGLKNVIEYLISLHKSDYRRAMVLSGLRLDFGFVLVFNFIVLIQLYF
ncbi:hypothetical protein VIN01S_22930 [Vibrio inusitatus NBRC 102082]|uniref:Uncharacterized protein n=1 Tax=Vibrio inusitatus NBRC 102082 TaxID=1219070 RepID=A0A4Y3HWD4_9VIBR|nr:hypothetical protein VIN01S_22930 [Vibrio inusitatus NBRC 102082]